MSKRALTGYPSIDKPWLKYYPEEGIHAPIPEKTMYEYIWENNKDFLFDIALQYFGAKITFGKLFENIEKTASAFYSMGVRKGDIVTIMSMQTPETIYTIYALNYIGAVANLVYITLSEEELKHNLIETNSKMLLILNIAIQKIENIKMDIGCPVVVINVSDSMPFHIRLGYQIKEKPPKHSFLTWKQFLSNNHITAPQENDHNAPAIIVYTSGSTGKPKGVELSNFNINSVAFQYKFVSVSICRRDSNLLFIPPFLSLGICYLHMPLSRGARAIICVNPEPGNIVNSFVKYKPNHFVSAPSHALMITERKIGDLGFIKSFGAGGEAVPADVEHKINQWLQKNGAVVPFSVGYGMTELSATVILNSNGAHKENTLGIPMIRTNVKVIDTDTKEELRYNQIGELCLNSPSQMKGYIGHIEETKKMIENADDGVRWVHTGDLGFVDEDGFVHYSGRIKRIFITKTGTGKDAIYIKIFPQRIEETLEKDEIVRSCGVIVKKDEERLHIPVAFVVLENKNLPSHKAKQILEKRVKRDLPEQDWPEEIYILDTMPITMNGKIDYHALDKLIQEGALSNH